MTTTRRDVLRGLSGLAIISTLPGCGGGDDTGTDAGNDAATTMDSAVTDSAVSDSAVADAAPIDAGACTSVGDTVANANGHSHTLTVTSADVAAGVDKQYTLMGSGHPHSLTLTAADFAQLAAGTPVMKASGSGGSPAHTHDVTVTCPA